MLLREMYQPLDEAISISHYADTVEAAVLAAITKTLTAEGYVNKHLGEWQGREFVSTRVIDNMTILQHYAQDGLHRVLAPAITRALNQDLTQDRGPDPRTRTGNYIEWIHFQELPKDVNGQVKNFSIELSRTYLDQLASEVKEQVTTTILENGYAHEPAAKDPTVPDNVKSRPGFYYRVYWNEIRRHLNKYAGEIAARIVDRKRNLVNQMTDTVLHELVHVMQHTQQFRRPGGSVEYRSYLDRTKGELHNLYQGPEQGWDFESEHFQKLYRASPQEIGAFAHNMALDIIRGIGLDEPGAEDTPLTATDFVEALRKVVGNEYRDPNNPRERAILNRYLKLAYQEVQRYIERKRAASKKN